MEHKLKIQHYSSSLFCFRYIINNNNAEWKDHKWTNGYEIYLFSESFIHINIQVIENGVKNI